MSPDEFGRRVLDWFDAHGRKYLPWKENLTPYRVWVSEIMLQQTQVATAIPYYERFVARFPDLTALADAGLDEVLGLWAGLGYYARARHLHRAARIARDRHGGELPLDSATLRSLPGIGRSTAGAILALAAGQRQPILDGNVKRLLARFAAVEGWPGQARVLAALWELADRYTPAARVADYTQAIMDLGALVCTPRRPRCDRCPLAAGCAAHAQGRQSAYPAPKPRRDSPVRATRMLLLCGLEGEVLLERRPPAGVWGGCGVFPNAPWRWISAPGARNGWGWRSRSGHRGACCGTVSAIFIWILRRCRRRSRRRLERSWKESGLSGITPAVPTNGGWPRRCGGCWRC